MMQALLRNLSPWQPQGCLIQQHSDVNNHKSIFFLMQSISYVYREFVCFGVLCLCSELLGEVSYIWGVLCRQWFLPSLHLITEISSLWEEEGVLLGRQCHHSSPLRHCRLPKSCFNVLNPKFIFSQSQRDPTHSALGEGLFIGNPGARMGVGLATATGFPTPA